MAGGVAGEDPVCDATDVADVAGEDPVLPVPDPCPWTGTEVVGTGVGCSGWDSWARSWVWFDGAMEQPVRKANTNKDHVKRKRDTGRHPFP